MNGEHGRDPDEHLNELRTGQLQECRLGLCSAGSSQQGCSVRRVQSLAVLHAARRGQSDDDDVKLNCNK